MSAPVCFPVAARREATFPVGIPIGLDVVLPDGQLGQVTGFLDRKDALIRDVIVRLPCGSTARAPLAHIRVQNYQPLMIINGGSQ
jgi:hypothetical protein